MTIRDDVERLMNLYPRIYFACHLRHVRDPQTGEQLSVTQASILDHLDEVDGTPLTTLAGHMGVTPSTMSLNIDRLQRKGYVVRQRDRADARRVLILLTEAGRRVRQANSVLDPDLVKELLLSLDAAARDQALDGLDTLAQAATRGGRR